MPWLETQNESLLKEWLRKTKAPMLSTRPDGEILWCNHSFEQLVGWTSVELIGQMTWKDLTADEEDLAADIELVNETAAGARTDYQLQKPYRTKNGAPKRVVIDVIRYPQDGEFECFLVSVFPVDRGVEFAMGQLTEIRSLLLTMIDRQPDGITYEKLLQFGKEHPLATMIISAVLGTLLFGDRVTEIIKAFAKP